LPLVRPRLVQPRLAKLALVASFAPMVVASTPTDAREGGHDGTWVLSLPKSGPHRQIGEVLTVRHEDDWEIYSAEVTFNGEVSGARYRAKPDGAPYPLYDLKSGAQIGTATLSVKRPGVTEVIMTRTREGRRVRLEHWETQGGASLISLLKNDEGEVTSVLVFDRR
jgi:hypothetical protein